MTHLIEVVDKSDVTWFVNPENIAYILKQNSGMAQNDVVSGPSGFFIGLMHGPVEQLILSEEECQKIFDEVKKPDTITASISGNLNTTGTETGPKEIVIKSIESLPKISTEKIEVESKSEITFGKDVKLPVKNDDIKVTTTDKAPVHIKHV